VRHEVPTGRAAEIELATENPEDEQVTQLRRIEGMNCFYCDVLDANGFDGSVLLLKAPVRETYVAVTEPHSKARVKAIMKAKTAGQMFFATGGRHVNSNEFFQARELASREAEIKVMEDEKKARSKYCQEQFAAVKLIKAKGDLNWQSHKRFTNDDMKLLLKWKKVKPTSQRKNDLIQAYVDAPKPPIKIAWKRSEQAKLDALLEQNVDVRETALGVATKQMANAVTNNLANLDTPTRLLLKRKLDEYHENKAPNAI
jgi:hypothetical protein